MRAIAPGDGVCHARPVRSVAGFASDVKAVADKALVALIKSDLNLFGGYDGLRGICMTMRFKKAAESLLTRARQAFRAAYRQPTTPKTDWTAGLPVNRETVMNS